MAEVSTDKNDIINEMSSGRSSGKDTEYVIHNDDNETIEVPRSRSNGGGVDGARLRAVPKIKKRVWDPEAKEFKDAGEEKVPEYLLEDCKKNSEENNTESEEQLSQFPEDAQGVVELLRNAGMTVEDITFYLKKGMNKEEGTQISEEKEAEESQESDREEPPVEEKSPRPDTENPPKNVSTFKVFEENSSRDSEDSGIGPSEVDIPDRRNEEIKESLEQKVKVSIETSAGIFKTKFIDIKEAATEVTAYYGRDDDIFIPAKSKDENDFITLKYGDKEIPVYFTGSDVEVPGTEMNVLIFPKK